MNMSRDEQSGAVSDCSALVAAISDDLNLLALLHDDQPTCDSLAALQECPLEEAFGLVLSSKEARAALAAMRDTVGRLPVPIESTTIDELAAGYADVYLRFTYRVSPTESVWLTEDGLERQGPMFALRDLYRQHHLRATDPAGRSEDHLVVQLRFAEYLLRSAQNSEDVAIVARFLDSHVLRWIRQFAGQLAHAGAPDFYVALALVTATYLDEMRDHLTRISGVARPAASVELTDSRTSSAVEEDRPFVPGVAPSW